MLIGGDDISNDVDTCFSAFVYIRARRCWTRSEGHHGEKIKNGSFASDLRFVHISRYAIKIPGEIV